MACLCLVNFAFSDSTQARSYKQASNTSTQPSTNDVEYAKCLQQKGITMYGTEWCPHCKRQKQTFGELFSYVNYVDCQADGAVCREKGVHGYPTWLLPDGKEVPQGTVEMVAKAAGCTLASADTKQPQVKQETATVQPTQKATEETQKAAEPAPAAQNNTASAGKVPTTQAEKREFYAKCLGQKNVTMFGLSKCPHCKAQKREFGELFQYVPYVECDRPTGRCLEASKKGRGYPTWLMEDGTKIEPGSVEEVALDAGCKISTDAAPAIVPASNAAN